MIEKENLSIKNWDESVLKLIDTGLIKKGLYWGVAEKFVQINHKITSISIIQCEEDVYDLTIENNENTHNYCLDCGVVVHNSGKTEVMASLGHLIDVTNKVADSEDGYILFVNNATFITDQALHRFIKRGIPNHKVGYWKSTAKSRDLKIVICTSQTLNNGIKNNNPEIINLLRKTTALFFDEGHHLTADSWTKIAVECNPE
jgi:hypothetical protein